MELERIIDKCSFIYNSTSVYNLGVIYYNLFRILDLDSCHAIWSDSFYAWHVILGL